MASSFFKLKEIEYFNRKLKILCQNLNGPCPLLSLCNVLILNGKIHIHSDYEQVSLEMITQLIANELLEKEPSTDMSPEVRAMHQERLGVAIGLLPSLQRGLDVNVKFNDVSSFEYTPELDCFDAFSVPLYHGWVYDPQDNVTKEVIQHLSYNHLQFKLVEARGLPEEHIGIANEKETMKSEENSATENRDMTVSETVADTESKEYDEAPSQNSTPESSPSESDGVKHDRRLRHEAKVIETFLQDTASQLTYAGLLALHRAIPEGSLCTFFRNNHFSTMLKRNESLYLLVTDLGYANMPSVVWELLDDIDGNTELVDSRFLPSSHPSQHSSDAVSVTKPLIDPDYLMALQLSEQQQQQQQQIHHSQQHKQQGVIGYAAPPVPPSSQQNQLPHPHPQQHPSTPPSDEDELSIPVLISSAAPSLSTQRPVASSVHALSSASVTSIHPASGSKGEVGGGGEVGRGHGSGNQCFPSSQSQLEIDHQAALDLQTALQLEESANSGGGGGGGGGGGRYQQHHLQQALSPSQLDSYRQAELEYFRKKDSSSSKKKKDSSGQSGCRIS